MNTDTPQPATPLPWELDENGDLIGDEGSIYIGQIDPTSGPYPLDTNAAYIVAACNAYPGLVEENKRLREALENVGYAVEMVLKAYPQPLEMDGSEQADAYRECVIAIGPARAALSQAKKGAGK